MLIRYPLASEYEDNVCFIKRFFFNASVFFFSWSCNPTTFPLFFRKVDNGEGSKCGVISYRYPKPWLLDCRTALRRCGRKNRGKLDRTNNAAIFATDNLKFGMLTLSELVILAVLWRSIFSNVESEDAAVCREFILLLLWRYLISLFLVLSSSSLQTQLSALFRHQILWLIHTHCMWCSSCGIAPPLPLPSEIGWELREIWSKGEFKKKASAQLTGKYVMYDVVDEQI